MSEKNPNRKHYLAKWPDGTISVLTAKSDVNFAPGEGHEPQLSQPGRNSITLFKTGAESYGIAPNEPEFEWRTSGPGREPMWIVARAAVMQCRRCGCREETPCHDKRLRGPCGWAAPGLCSACLNREEFEEFLQEVTEITERGQAA